VVWDWFSGWVKVLIFGSDTGSKHFQGMLKEVMMKGKGNMKTVVVGGARRRW
jgi:hypothetical protein